jgi:hypothetical protein
MRRLIYKVWCLYLLHTYLRPITYFNLFIKAIFFRIFIKYLNIWNLILRYCNLLLNKIFPLIKSIVAIRSLIYWFWFVFIVFISFSIFILVFRFLNHIAILLLWNLSIWNFIFEFLILYSYLLIVFRWAIFRGWWARWRYILVKEFFILQIFFHVWKLSELFLDTLRTTHFSHF